MKSQGRAYIFFTKIKDVERCLKIKDKTIYNQLMAMKIEDDIPEILLNRFDYFYFWLFIIIEKYFIYNIYVNINNNNIEYPTHTHTYIYI